MESREMTIAEKLQHALETINEPEGRARLHAYLMSRPFPRFWAHPIIAQRFIREEADGTRIEGHFEHGIWMPDDGGVSNGRVSG